MERSENNFKPPGCPLSDKTLGASVWRDYGVQKALLDALLILELLQNIAWHFRFQPPHTEVAKTEKNTRYFWSICANNMSEFPGIPCIYTALAGAGRFSLGRKFYFNFPSRCCHYGEIIIIWPVLLKKTILYISTNSVKITSWRTIHLT